MTNTEMQYSIEHTRRLADALLGQKQFSNAKSSYSKILKVAPSQIDCREKARTCVQNLPLSDKHSFINACLSAIRNERPTAGDAIPGWLYSSLFEAKFSTPSHFRSPPKNANKAGNTRPQGAISKQRNPYNLLSELIGITDPTNLFRSMQFVARGSEAAVLFDSTRARTPQDLEPTDELEPELNVCIIGGGCVGLTLANSLKISFGSRARILVIENRTSSPHIKEPYGRKWLTYIPIETLNGLIDPTVSTLISRVGTNGMIGVPLNIYETLMLLSSKCLGVEFFFGECDEILRESQASWDITFDATGGRLIQQSISHSSANELGPTFIAENTLNYDQGFRKFGLPSHNLPSKLEIATIWHGRYLRPLVQGQPIAVPNLKITGIPFTIFEELASWCHHHNDDAKFYIWPGNLQAPFNEALVFICLTPPEHIFFKKNVTSPTTLSEVRRLLHPERSTDERTVELLELLNNRDSLGNSRVEPPFVYSPYFLPEGDYIEQQFSSPLVPVGDTVYNGNPKVGNGLARHLKNACRIHDILLENWK
ncbi:hypothetical protein [Rhodopirellula baltica]